MIILGEISQYTVDQIEQIKRVEGILYCEDYKLYKLFRDEGIVADMIYRENKGIDIFCNNVGIEINEVILVPSSTTFNEDDPILRNYDVYRAKGGYYG